MEYGDIPDMLSAFIDADVANAAIKSGGFHRHGQFTLPGDIKPEYSQRQLYDTLLPGLEKLNAPSETVTPGLESKVWKEFMHTLVTQERKLVKVGKEHPDLFSSIYGSDYKMS